ncbi:MAG: PilZ domain-containing protein [Myxococcaceae bacterium]|jgi:hypothetical protein|nr:PilZ domain-containing protein [Myxococcaceae bacterium]MCA3013537.1 PilZ domain-containing protein [Myxococcaceae bacterium]
MSFDSREDRRFACLARVGGPDTSSSVTGAATGLSRAGLCLTSTVELTRGQTVDMTVDLAGRAVDAVGEVRWARQRPDGSWEAWLRFISIAPVSLAAIDEATKERPVTSSFLRQFALR